MDEPTTPAPTVGLLNVGHEENKGDVVRRQAYELLADSELAFVGNVEAEALFAGPDVIVTDGFTGNLVLKTAEAVLRFVLSEARLGQASVQASTSEDPIDAVGGSFLLGVDGTVVVSHGASSDRAIENAIALAVEALERTPSICAGVTETVGAP